MQQYAILDDAAKALILHVASCISHVAYCLLLVAYCLWILLRLANAYVGTFNCFRQLYKLKPMQELCG